MSAPLRFGDTKGDLRNVTYLLGFHRNHQKRDHKFSLGVSCLVYCKIVTLTCATVNSVKKWNRRPPFKLLFPGEMVSRGDPGTPLLFPFKPHCLVRTECGVSCTIGMGPCSCKLSTSNDEIFVTDGAIGEPTFQYLANSCGVTGLCRQ